MKPIQNGFWSGLIATGPMTLALFRIFESLPRKQQQALPPSQLTKEVEYRSGAVNRISWNQHENLTMFSHLAYGGACGSLYSAVSPYLKGNPIAKGVLFGLGVWGISYMGWLPALGFRTAAVRMTPARNAMMMAAHVVWGASLGMAESQLRRRDAFQK